MIHLNSRVRRALLAVLILIIIAHFGPSPAAEPTAADSDEPYLARCPHVAIAEAELKRHARPPPPPIAHVTRPALQRELLLREQQDQQGRNALFGKSLDKAAADAAAAFLVQVDASNLHRLLQIIRLDGLPTARMVGYDGVSAAWLLIQHSDTDPAFQERMLPLIEQRARRGELRLQEYALLYDRVQVAHHKPQRYGSQFKQEGQDMVPGLTEDPSHLDVRRRAMGLLPMADYQCALRTIYLPEAPDGQPSAVPTP